MESSPVPTAPRLRHRSRHRLTVGLLMLLIAALAVGLAWVRNAARAQREAVEAIRRAGGGVRYDYDPNYDGAGPPGRLEPRGPKWLRSIVGDEPFRKVVGVSQSGGTKPYRRADLEFLKDLPDVEILVLNVEKLALTPDGDLAESDWGSLRALKRLRHLRLYGLGLDRAAHARLGRLTQLRELGLFRTGLTDAGAAALLDPPNLESLVLIEPAITDAALATLARSKSLKRLRLESTNVTQAGIEALEAAGVKVSWRPTR
jgi:hypothetical protein